MELTLVYVGSQIFTILTYALLVMTYYVKSRKKVLVISFLSIVANLLAYVLLNAGTGVAMCVVAIARNAYFLVIYFAIGVVTYFTYEDFWSLLSVFATMLYTYSVWQKKTLVYKLCGIPIGILWVCYNAYVKSIFGVILEAILLISSVIGYWMERKQQKSNQ